MRTRQHNKNLIHKTSDLNDRHFLIRLLYKDCYYVIFVFHCVISMRADLCSSCVCQLLLKNFMMMMIVRFTKPSKSAELTRDLLLMLYMRELLKMRRMSRQNPDRLAYLPISIFSWTRLKSIGLSITSK